jgi:hypothetical protein
MLLANFVSLRKDWEFFLKRCSKNEFEIYGTLEDLPISPFIWKTPQKLFGKK